MKKTIQTIFFLILIIGICAVIVRLLTGSETLSEYAENNPELAYATIAPVELSDTGVTGISDTDVSVSDSVSKNGESPTEAASEPTPEPTAAPTPTPAPDPSESFTVSELTEEVKARITGISYPADAENLRISYDDLRYLKLLYYDFNGEVQEGELICNEYIANDLIEIFRELYENEYQIERIRLVDEYAGDDMASMLDDNTSCFNYRLVENTNSLSKHALGLAIDVNPFYNPYIVYGKGEGGGDYISPAEAAEYVDRTRDFPHKIDKDDLCYQLFAAHGFTWGGDWTSQKDYQHFQKVP